MTDFAMKPGAAGLKPIFYKQAGGNEQLVALLAEWQQKTSQGETGVFFKSLIHREAGAPTMAQDERVMGTTHRGMFDIDALSRVTESVLRNMR